MNPRIAVLLLFLVLFALASYSVFMPIAAVDPLASRASVEYVLGKPSGPFSPEVREVVLNGDPITSVDVVFYKRLLFFPQAIEVTVTLHDDYGNVIGSGSDCRIYWLGGNRGVTVPISPNPQQSQVARVETSIQVVLLCI